jgi:hypothetical protein
MHSITYTYGMYFGLLPVKDVFGIIDVLVVISTTRTSSFPVKLLWFPLL